MKLIIVLGIKESQDELNEVFRDVKVPIFSKVNIEGLKTQTLPIDMSNWFGNDENPDFSVMFFGFVAKKDAETIMRDIEKLNSNKDRVRPFHAFQLPVEKFV